MVHLPSAPAAYAPMHAALHRWPQRLEGWYRDPGALLAQLRDGVRLGYEGPRTGFLIRPNHPSALLPAGLGIIDEEILSELRQGRMAGPFTLQQIQQMFAFFRSSPLAAVPKQDGSWRTIDDLTAGDDSAVNTHIPDSAASVRYASFDDAVLKIRRLGRGCWLAKVDWKAAFRQVAVHRADWPLLGIAWRGMLFVRLVLPFGARSSPRLFTQFAQAFAGALRRMGAPHVVFYLDDFLLLGASEEACKQAVLLMEQLAAELGVQLHPTKREGPAQIISFLGIGIDTIAMRVFLPRPKQDKLVQACLAMLRSGRASLRALRSIVGLMLHAAQVVHPGRLMARRMLEFKRPLERRALTAPAPFIHVPHSLPSDVLDDLRWWAECLHDSSMIPRTPDWADPIVLQTDASTSFGAGAVFRDPTASSSSSGLTAWFFLPWTDHAAAMQTWIAADQELATIAIALETFGGRLAGLRLRIHSDSANSVHALSRSATTSSLRMRLLRGVHAIALRFDFHIQLVSHIRGTHNVCADAASRLPVQDPDRLRALGLLPQLQVQARVPHWLLSLQTLAPSLLQDSASAPAQQSPLGSTAGSGSVESCLAKEASPSTR